MRRSIEKPWESYQEAAPAILQTIADKFGVTSFEGKQSIQGEATEWEIDAKGVRQGGEVFVIVECRRYTKSRLKQEELGGLAFRIQDTGASGGIVVSPLGLQEGARRIAEAKGIHSVKLSADSTIHDYFMEFMGNFFLRRTERIQWRDGVRWRLRDEDGNVIKEGESRD